jgi:hypothetical protein
VDVQAVRPASRFVTVDTDTAPQSPTAHTAERYRSLYERHNIKLLKKEKNGIKFFNNNLNSLIMKKLKILAYLLTIWALLPVSQTNAQNKLPLNDWKINNFGKGKSSEISANGILLRQYSAVFYEGLNTELSSVIVECKWKNSVDYVDMPIKLTLYYQKGPYENIIQKIPKGTKTEQKLIFKPQNNSGRRIIKIEIQHGSTAMEVMIHSVEIVVTL